ncbi:MAG: 6-phosphogluconolactonase [Xanthomonadales bacterium]|nr:6-phosphogluconolactonase [Xanthomonadales bacterium]
MDAMNAIEHAHPDDNVVAAALAADLALRIDQAIDARGQARLALAGGNTPMALYRLLAAHPLPWSRVVAVATDERCVPHDHPACNHAALQQAFASAEGLDLRALTVADGDSGRSVEHANALLARLDQPFDLVLLGMGVDGHFASLFPGAAQLAAGLADDAPDALRIDPVPLPAEAPHPRISLSLRRLLHSRHRVLLIKGQAKRAVLQSATSGGDTQRAPIAAVLRAPGPPLQVHWSP